MDAHAFQRDLEAKPAYLRDLAASLRRNDPWAELPGRPSQVVLLGMGSSGYASDVAAARLQARGVPAVSTLASSDLLPALEPGALVVAVSATGGSRETVDAVRRISASAPAHRLVALTNQPDSTLGRRADTVVELAAGPEAGGVACRTYAHTLALLLTLERRLTGGPDVADLVDAAADAADDLLDRRPSWLPAVAELLDGPDGCHVVAPAHRLCSARQSALMLREGPRRPATGCETGDWSHVDVYLTKTTDYRMLLLTGSRWEDELLDWVRQRSSTVVAVGGHVGGQIRGQGTGQVARTLRYRGDERDDVRLLTETLVAELVAARLWTA